MCIRDRNNTDDIGYYSQPLVVYEEIDTDGWVSEIRARVQTLVVGGGGKRSLVFRSLSDYTY